MLRRVFIGSSLAAAAGAMAGAARAQQRFRFGVTPWQRGQTFDDIRPLYRPLLDHLGRALPASFTLIGARSYEEMRDYLIEGQVDVAAISPAPYVMAKARNPGIELIATELSWNEDRSAHVDSYTGMIVALRDRADITGVADLKGKVFGFVSESSTSGYQVPSAMLRRMGIDHRSHFARSLFLGSHPRVTDALVAGSIDAGATWDFNLRQATAKHGDVFKIVQTFPPIPNLCIAAHPGMPQPMRARLRAALLAVEPSLLQGLSAVGYVERPDSFYDPVRAIVGLEP
ncbi:MAG TPA: phosphate/phosphite/phosphonate ABC transporter substrate-binding protein [Alphaproteobacteria bacterium]|nr:phosphate/phosphite/phosphonate ABC transporter substrate-binding protein [Alphaproteobacteria bacterium]